MAFGNQLIEIAQACLVFGQQNQMISGTAAPSPFFHSRQRRVHLGQPLHPRPAQPGQQVPEDLAAYFGIVKGPVVMKGRQFQMAGHGV